MTLPFTDHRETYSSPDVPNPPPAFESITYILDVTVLHRCFCWFHSPFTLVASSKLHPYVLLFSSSALEGSCKKQSQVSCQTFAVRSSANMVSTAILLSMPAIANLLVGEVIMFYVLPQNWKHCCIQHLDCALVDFKECVLLLLLQNSFLPFLHMLWTQENTCEKLQKLSQFSCEGHFHRGCLGAHNASFHLHLLCISPILNMLQKTYISKWMLFT